MLQLWEWWTEARRDGPDLHMCRDSGFNGEHPSIQKSPNTELFSHSEMFFAVERAGDRGPLKN